MSAFGASIEISAWPEIVVVAQRSVNLAGGLEGAVQVPHLASVLHVGDPGIDRLHRALGLAVRQLNQSGLDSAVAQLLMSRKSAELEDLMKRGRSNVS
jgi:hypothetical protein